MAEKLLSASKTGLAGAFTDAEAVVATADLDEVIDASLVKKLAAKGARPSRGASVRKDTGTQASITKTPDTGPHPPLPQGRGRS